MSLGAHLTMHILLLSYIVCAILFITAYAAIMEIFVILTDADASDACQRFYVEGIAFVF